MLFPFILPIKLTDCALLFIREKRSLVFGKIRRHKFDVFLGCYVFKSFCDCARTHAHKFFEIAVGKAYALSHLFGNFMARPDFIAWCPAPRNWAVSLCIKLGAMSVMWTALPEHDTQKLETDNDAVIFQWYAPKPQYK